MDEGRWQGTVEMFRRTETAKGRAESGYFSIEGIRLHERALRAGICPYRVITTSSLLNADDLRTQSLVAELQNCGTQFQVVPEDIIEEFTGKRELGPLLGLVKLPGQSSLQDVVRSSNHPSPLILVVVDVQDPGNVGALLRTAHASGVTALAAVGPSDPFHPKALRTSMGSLFKLPVLRYETTSQLMSELKELGIERVGTAVSKGILLPEATFSDCGTAVFLGSESWGLPEEIQSAVDWLVSIPMVSTVDSYSVNAAAAIILYEIGRRRYSR